MFRNSARSTGADAAQLPDGKLGDYPGDRTLMSRLTEQVATQIEQVRPDVVITWGPDGGTGHPEHRIVSNIATQLQRFGAPGMPEMLETLAPEFARAWSGRIPFIPASPSMTGDDLFR